MYNITIFPDINQVWFYLLMFSVCGSLAVYLLQHRQIPGAVTLCLAQSSKALWALAHIFCGIIPDPETRFFWVNITEYPLVLLIWLWFEFILVFCQQKDPFPKPALFLIRSIFIGMLLVILTDSRLGWYWGDIYMDRRIFSAPFTPAMWIIMGYCYLIIMLSTYICIRRALSVEGLRRQQAIAISITPLFTTLGNVFEQFTSDSTMVQAIGMLLSALYVTWVFYRWRIYSIIPLARDAVTGSMAGGIVIVDAKGYIVTMNAAAAGIFNGLPVLVGGRFRQLAAAWPDLAQCDTEEKLITLEAVRAFPEGERHFQVSMTPLTGGRYLLGKVLVIQDVTDRKQAQFMILEQQKALTMLEERNRLGRELHDTRGQFTGYVKTQGQAIRLLLEKQQTGDALLQLEQLIAAADEAYVDARDSIAGLKGQTEDWNFFGKLSESLDNFKRMSGVSVTYSGPLSVPPRWISQAASVHLLRIIQEALTNIRKHADASRVDIWLTASGSLELTIADNGCGFDADSSNTGGFGLGIIRERAAEMGGNCSISSRCGSGTTVMLQVPLTGN